MSTKVKVLIAGLVGLLLFLLFRPAAPPDIHADLQQRLLEA
ncbi:MAG: hypothetical protein ABFS22_02165 [Pseudomonadota bacterium]